MLASGNLCGPRVTVVGLLAHPGAMLAAPACEGEPGCLGELYPLVTAAQGALGELAEALETLKGEG
jgi:hypothetical protein